MARQNAAAEARAKKEAEEARAKKEADEARAKKEAEDRAAAEAQMAAEEQAAIYASQVQSLTQMAQEIQDGIQRMPSDNVAELDIRLAKINEMEELTHQARETCVFYLESTDWDLSAAVDLFNSMRM